MKTVLLGAIFISGILNLIMGIVIIFGSKEKNKSLPFAYYSFATFLVALSYYFIYNTELAVSVRISYSLGALIPTFLLAWIHNYSSMNPHKLKTALIYIIGGLFVILPFLDGLVISVISKSATRGFIEERGVLFPLYLGFFIFAYGIVLFKLIRLYLITAGEKKKEAMVILTGFSLYGGIGILLGLILPYLGYDQFTDLDIPFSIIFIGFTTYAIVEYRWMNIKVIAVEILAALISGMALMDVFLADTFLQRVYKSISFMIFAVLSAFMVRGVMHEINRKEELQKLSDSLASANEELKKLDRLKSEFLSFASHQLKAPMTVVKGYASLIYDGSYGIVPEKVKETVVKVQQVADQTIGLVNDFLNLRKIEEGKMEYQFSQINITALVRNIVDELTLIAKQKNLNLSFEDLKEIIIKADEQKMRQVIQNLVENAIKYTGKGFVKVELKEMSDSVLIIISDSGRGISKELLPNLFQQFSRAVSVKKIQGTGLGLYIAKEIITAHHGKIWAESEGEGKGSMFIVEVPLGQTDAQAKRGRGGSD